MRMNLFFRKLSLSLSLVLSLAGAMPTGAYAAAQTSQSGARQAVDFNSYVENLPVDYAHATQLPLTGYFTKDVGGGRTVKVYISEHAPTRSKFTVVAVPDGVDTYSFLHREGWLNLVEQKGECLFALEPGESGWGTRESEEAYVHAAMTFLTTCKNDHDVVVFSTFGTFYLVGYRAGCAPLEAWAADYPIYVAAQAYIGGTSAGKAYLDATGVKQYDGHNTGGYDPGMDDGVFTETLKKLGGTGSFITRSDVPVPTWLAGYDQNSYSISYWKNANDVLNAADQNVYRQDIASTAWQTRFANDSILRSDPDAKYGISQVKVSSAYNGLRARNIYDFLSVYIRYTTTFAYSNHLEYRLNYGAMNVNLQKTVAGSQKTVAAYAKPGGKTGTYEFWAQASMPVKAYDDKTGTVIGGVAALTDINGDGVLDPREYLIYIPDSAKTLWGAQGAPAVLVHPGNTQTASVFMDCSMWWQVANEEGCIVAVVGEQYSSAVAVTYPSEISDSADFDYMLTQIVTDTAPRYVKADTGRIYGAGHSLGSKTIQTLAQTNTDLAAAVASTSFPSMGEINGTGEMMPAYLIHGQSDLPFEMPDLWGNDTLKAWIHNFFTANGLQTDINSYTDSDLTGRFHTYTWQNSQSIPMVQYGYTLAREHNCMPDETRLEWDFLKHFSFAKDTSGHVVARFYSESGFKARDAIQISKG